VVSLVRLCRAGSDGGPCVEANRAGWCDIRCNLAMSEADCKIPSSFRLPRDVADRMRCWDRSRTDMGAASQPLAASARPESCGQAAAPRLGGAKELGVQVVCR
jgi:hypothetical protein